MCRAGEYGLKFPKILRLLINKHMLLFVLQAFFLKILRN